MSYLGNGLLQRHLVGQFVISSTLLAQCRDVARQLDKKGLSALASFSSRTLLRKVSHCFALLLFLTKGYLDFHMTTSKTEKKRRSFSESKVIIKLPGKNYSKDFMAIIIAIIPRWHPL